MHQAANGLDQGSSPRSPEWGYWTSRDPPALLFSDERSSKVFDVAGSPEANTRSFDSKSTDVKAGVCRGPFIYLRVLLNSGGLSIYAQHILS